MKVQNNEGLDRRRFVVGASGMAFLTSSWLFRLFPQIRENRAKTEGTVPAVLAGAESWTIHNGLVAKHLWWDGHALRGLIAMPGWEAERHLGRGEIFVDVAGQVWPPPSKNPIRLLRASQSHTTDAARVDLTFGAESSPLVVTLSYVCRQGDSAIEETCQITNSGDTRIEDVHRFDSCYLYFPLRKTVDDALGVSSGSPRRSGDASLTMHWVEGLHDDQKRIDELYATYRVSSQPLEAGDTVDFRSGLWSSNEKQPAVVLETEELSYFAGLCWSGQWNLVAERDADFFTLQVGLADAVIPLAPGETITSPASFCGVVQGSVDDAWNAMHAHCRVALMPPVPDDFPWVTYNTWFNFNTNFKEDGLRLEVDRAAALGIEVFYIDDGWFAGSSAHGKWGRGTGNWVENREKFPSGLRSFADYVHQRGMKFGLWVEPERLDARFADQPGLPPNSWLATRQGNLVRWGFGKTDGEQAAYQVCFGNSAARDWVIQSLTRMVRDYRVDWLKWDHNRYEVCEETSHGHGGSGDWAHTKGVHEVLLALRKEFPNLIIENCAAGGHRFDYGMMQFTHVTWTSDQSAPGYVSRRHIYGASHPYPTQYLTSWYVPSNQEPALTELSDAQMETLFRNHMLGAFGISARLGGWTPEFTAAAKRSIALYKRTRRFLRGKAAWLTSQAPLRSPLMEPAPVWEVMQFFLEPAESLVWAFRSKSSAPSTVIRPQFLNRKLTYRVHDEDERLQPFEIAGGTLMDEGLSVSVRERDASAVVYVVGI